MQSLAGGLRANVVDARSIDVPKVLIIDDDEVFGELTKQRLETAGLEVEFQHGAFGQNLHRMRTGHYELVVLDVNMPGLSGTKLCELIREGDSPCKILLCSSMDDATLLNLMSQHGADAAISKSATRVALLEKVNQMLGGGEHNDTH